MYEDFTHKEYGQRFKLRAEFLSDIIEFLHEFPGKKWNVKIEQTDNLPDTYFEFSTYSTLKELLLCLYEIPDSHVMMDTISPINKYTGDRKYIDWDFVKIDDEFVTSLTQ